jgi:hypothetical protein
MRNKILLFLTTFLFFCSAVKAQTFNKPTAYIGLNYYNYHEKYAGHDPLMELQSSLPTILIGYRDDAAIRSNNKSSDSLSWLAEASYGRVNYTQYIISGAHTHDYWTIQAEGLYALPESFYLGLGYRYLYDYLSDFGPSGYDRKQQYLYLPVGYVLNGTESSAKLQFNYLLKGQNNSDSSSNQPSGVFKQNSGYGLDLSFLPIKNSNIEFFAKYWNIDDSKLSNGYLEPHNITYEIGFKVAF